MNAKEGEKQNEINKKTFPYQHIVEYFELDGGGSVCKYGNDWEDGKCLLFFIVSVYVGPYPQQVSFDLQQVSFF